MGEIKYEQIVDFIKNGNYPVTVRKTITGSEIFAVDANHLFLITVCITRKHTHQIFFTLQVVKKGTTDDIIKSIHATFGRFEKRKQATN